jgi:hypothetical protein
MSAHEFHKRQAVVNAMRFSVRAVEEFDSFLNRCETTESARDKRIAFDIGRNPCMVTDRVSQR